MKKQIFKIINFILPAIFSLLFFEAFGGSLNAQVVSINTTGAVGDASSMLDVNASDKGMLIPRISLTSAIDNATIGSPATSLLIYNSATAGTYPNDIVPGFYYWDGTKWIPLIRPTGILAFADFYALMPSDNSATIAAGAAIEFPNAGPTSGSAITNTSATQFQLAAIGTYSIVWQVSIAEAGQLVLELNTVENLATVVGRATGTNQIVGNRLITTVSANTILRIVNPVGNSTALTLTPLAGGTSPVSASLVITRIQ